MKKLFLSMVFGGLLMADPSPFGLEMGKATMSDLEEKFPIANSYDNEYGKVAKVDSKNIEMTQLSDAMFVFSDEKMVLVALTFSGKNKFDELHSSLKDKYKVKRSKIPFVGDKEVVFVDGNTEIYLLAPHLSFDTTLEYRNIAWAKGTFGKMNAKEKAKKDSEKSML